MIMGRDRKKAERQVRAEHRRQKKNSRHLDTSETQGDFLSLRNQLGVIGLTIKEVTGDGYASSTLNNLRSFNLFYFRNCLFRAFGDQLFGSGDRHVQLRREVVEFMRAHPDDFAPFVLDAPSFERHLELLGKDGTYGGRFTPDKHLQLISNAIYPQAMTPSWPSRDSRTSPLSSTS